MAGWESSLQKHYSCWHSLMRIYFLVIIHSTGIILIFCHRGWYSFILWCQWHCWYITSIILSVCCYYWPLMTLHCYSVDDHCSVLLSRGIIVILTFRYSVVDWWICRCSYRRWTWWHFVMSWRWATNVRRILMTWWCYSRCQFSSLLLSDVDAMVTTFCDASSCNN